MRTGTSLQQILRIGDCESELELVLAISEATSTIEFDYFQYGADFLLDRHQTIHKTLSNFPTRWIERYSACKYQNIDPAFGHALTSVRPVMWAHVPSQTMSTEQKRFLDDARNHEIRYIAAFPIQTRNGDSAVLSFATRTDGVETAEISARILGDGSLIASFAHDVMRNLVNKERNVLQAPLTHRELECLRWIAIGKSNWEIAMIFGMSEHGVVYYVRKLLWKLGVSNRHHAVDRATAYGLL